MKKLQNTSRRKLLLGSIAAAGGSVATQGLPAKWAKPVVDTTMLPAHAMTSDGTQACTFSMDISNNGSLTLSAGTYGLTISGTDPTLLTIVADNSDISNLDVDTNVTGASVLSIVNLELTSSIEPFGGDTGIINAICAL